MLDDECEVTSTRDFLTLRWRGARFRQLIGPSIEDAKRRNSTVDYRDIQMNLEGDAVHITATAVFKQSGIERPWLATVARDDEGKLVFREFHDGVPHPTGE